MARTSKRSFKPLDERRVKEGAARTNSKYDSIFKQGVNVLKMNTGVNNLRVARGSDDGYWNITVWVHDYIGIKKSTYLCPKAMRKSKTCPICDASNDAAEAGDKDESYRLSAKERAIAYVIHREDEKTGLKVWDMSSGKAHEIDAVSDTKRGVLDISHPEDGFDLSILRHGTGLSTKYSGLQIDRESSPLSDDPRQLEAWVEEIDRKPLVELLRYYPEDYLADILSGRVQEKDEGDEDESRDDDRRDTRNNGRSRDEDRRSARSRDDEERDTRRSNGRGRGEPDDPDERTERRSRSRDDGEERTERRARGRDDEEPRGRQRDGDEEAGEARRWRRSEEDDQPDDTEDPSTRRTARGGGEERRRGRGDDDEQPRNKRDSNGRSRARNDDDDASEQRTSSRRERDGPPWDEDEGERRSRSRERADDGEERTERRRR